MKLLYYFNLLMTATMIMSFLAGIFDPECIGFAFLIGFYLFICEVTIGFIWLFYDWRNKLLWLYASGATLCMASGAILFPVLALFFTYILYTNRKMARS